MDKTASTPAVYALVDDLFFVAKIRETARQIGVPLEPVSQEEALRKALASGAASGVIVDMNCRSLDAVQVIRSLKSDPPGDLPVLVGFLRHTQTELFRQAEQAGLDRVMPRSELVKELPQLLRSLSPASSPAGSSSSS